MTKKKEPITQIKKEINIVMPKERLAKVVKDTKGKTIKAPKVKVAVPKVKIPKVHIHPEYDSVLDIPGAQRGNYVIYFGVPTHKAHWEGVSYIDAGELERVKAILYEIDPKFVNEHMQGLKARGIKILEERKLVREADWQPKDEGKDEPRCESDSENPAEDKANETSDDDFDRIAQLLNVRGQIASLTEKNSCFWNGDPKIYPPLQAPTPGKLTVAELFCGLGGTSLGFEMAGFETIFGADLHAPSIETFRHAHPHATCVLGDITKIVRLGETHPDNLIVSEIKKSLNGRQLDVLMAGVPCQGFSLANKKRNHLDARNYLFLYFVEVVKALRPKAVMIENVSGMRTLRGGQFLRRIEHFLDKAGYRTHHDLLNAADYGVPQKRQRVVFLGGLHGTIAFPPAKIRKNNYLTVRDAISDLPSLKSGKSKSNYDKSPKTNYQTLMRGNCTALKNHEAPSHPDEVIKKIGETVPGTPMYPKFKQRIRLSWDLPSPTQLSGGIRPQFQFGHPQDARGLSVRERCRIQSIPDFVEVYGGLVQGRVQTGNAVPPLLAKEIAESILGYLSKWQD